MELPQWKTGRQTHQAVNRINLSHQRCCVPCDRRSPNPSRVYTFAFQVRSGRLVLREPIVATCPHVRNLLDFFQEFTWREIWTRLTTLPTKKKLWFLGFQLSFGFLYSRARKREVVRPLLKLNVYSIKWNHKHLFFATSFWRSFEMNEMIFSLKFYHFFVI